MCAAVGVKVCLMGNMLHCADLIIFIARHAYVLIFKIIYYKEDDERYWLAHSLHGQFICLCLKRYKCRLLNLTVIVAQHFLSVY